MKNKRLWLSVALTVLVVVCAMLILSRVNEARSNAAPAAPTDLILPPDIQTTAKPDTKEYDDLPDVDISSWEYLIASQAHNISDYVPDVSKISGSQSTFDSRAVDALNALLKAARDAGWSPYIYCAYRPYLTQKQQYEDQVSENMRKGDTRDEAETAAARIAAPPGTSDHQTGLGADIVDQYYSSLSVDTVNGRQLRGLRLRHPLPVGQGQHHRPQRAVARALCRRRGGAVHDRAQPLPGGIRGTVPVSARQRKKRLALWVTGWYDIAVRRKQDLTEWAPAHSFS